MQQPSRDDLAPLALNERELFSLYAQYPEIDFDPECTKRPEEATEHFSSPESKTGEQDNDSVQLSSSTAHTTPSRHEMYSVNAFTDGEYTALRTQLQQCDLPAQTVDLLTNMGAQIVQMGSCLLVNDRSTDELAALHGRLLQQLQHSTRKVDEEIQTIAFVTDFAPFNVIPTDISLWSNYQQRTSLTSKHLSCPSQTELNLLNHLLRLFDAFVYHPYLHRKKTNETLSLSIEDTANTLYNALLTLLSSYQRWIRTMRSFKATYMTPIMRRIQDSPWIQREIAQVEHSLEAAQTVLAKADGAALSMVLGEEQVRAATKGAERRAKSSASKVPVVAKEKTKTRFDREHTI